MERIFLVAVEWTLRSYFALACGCVMREVGTIAGIAGKRSTKLELRPHKEDLHDISSFRFARDRHRFNLNDLPVLTRPFHHLAFRKFGHDLVIVEFFLTLNAVVEIHDVFHD
jgi:hypothetical protein